jgi:Flp pilus assembly protein TadD
LAFFDGQRKDMTQYARRLWVLNSAPNFAKLILALDALQNKKFKDVEVYVINIKGSGFESLIVPVVRAWAKAGLKDEAGAVKALEPLKKIKVFASMALEHQTYIQDYLKKNKAAEKSYREMISGRKFRSFQPLLGFSGFLIKTGRGEEGRAFLTRQAKIIPNNLHIRDALWRLSKGKNNFSPATSPARGVGVSLLQAANELATIDARPTAVIYARLATFSDPNLEEAQYLLANLFMANDQNIPALRVYQGLKSGSPFSEAAREREAVALDKNGDFEGAIRLLLAEFNKRPDDLSLLQTIGDLYQAKGKQEEALAYYTRAMAKLEKLTAENWILVFTRGIANEQLGHWERAEKDFKLALVLRPDDPQVLNYLGYSWIDRGINIEEAKGMIELAVKQRPDDGYIVDSLGWVQYLLGDFQVAVETLERAVKLQPSDATINDHLGDAYWKVGREREARFQWSRALILDATEDEQVVIQAKIDFGLLYSSKQKNKTS